MNPKTYAQILDAAAADKVPDNVNLAPRILARISAEKRPVRRPKLKLAFILLLVLLAAALFAAGPQCVLAAVRGWLGYLPGIGFVEQGTDLRVLAEPVEQERDGITVMVEQVVADSQRTTVLFTVEGLGPQHRPGAEGAPHCTHSPLLRLPGGGELALTGGGGEGWPGGYSTRGVFPALPQEEDRPKLVIPCLNDTRPGAAPENWEFELTLQPAPPDFQPLPVIELPTTPASPLTDAVPATVIPASAEPAALPTPTPSVDHHGIHFQVEKLVELEDGYLLQGSLEWQGTEFDLAGFSAYELQVRDAAGQMVPIEPVEAEEIPGDPIVEKRLPWSIRTASKQYAGPLTLTLPQVSIDQEVDVSFELDLGASPQPGQTWELNRTLEIEGRPLTVSTVSMVASPDGRSGTYGLSFTLHADPEELSSVSLWDPDNHSAMLSSSGGSDHQGTIRWTMNYDYLPTGLRRIQITQVSYPLPGPWVVSVDLPTNSAPAAPVPTQPAACLTAERLAQLQTTSSETLPAGLGGRFLVSGPAIEGVHFPTLYVTDLDGGNQVTVGSGGWADLSPDGRQVIYGFSDGTHLYDLESGVSSLLPWAQENDYHPLWSPDGKWLAFERSGDGIYVTQPDGSSLRKVSDTGISSSLLAWRPDGKGLLVGTQGAEGSTLQTVELETGAITDHFMIDGQPGGFGHPSPDGQRVTFTEKVFGRPAYGLFVANLDGSEKRPIAILDGIMLAAPAWSPDGRWLLVAAHEVTLDGYKSTNYLIQPDTCEVIPLPRIQDAIVSWIALPAVHLP